MRVSGARTETLVRTGAGSTYPVRVGAGVLDDLPGLLSRLAPAYRYALIADERVFALHGERVLSKFPGGPVSVSAHTFPAGEEHKNREQWSRLTDELLSQGLARDGCVVALGGGVTGDLAGFVAASYMRGIAVAHLPTSLVAMVDSSVGGKTGVDVPAGKNLVGAFHPPRFVLADTELASTLPRDERAQGLAEAVKHGAILDADYFAGILERSPRLLDGDPEDTAWMVARSVELKAGVVSEDEKEEALREILNFGHTLGHAIEAGSEFRVRHGSAVALGMILEAKLGERMGVTQPGVHEKLAQALRVAELPVAATVALDADQILDLASRDKKGRVGELRCVLLDQVGSVARGDKWSHRVDARVVREVLEDTL